MCALKTASSCGNFEARTARPSALNAVDIEPGAGGDEQLAELRAVFLHAGPLVGILQPLLERSDRFHHRFHHHDAVCGSDRAGENSSCRMAELLVAVSGKRFHEGDRLVTTT